MPTIIPKLIKCFPNPNFILKLKHQDSRKNKTIVILQNYFVI